MSMTCSTKSHPLRPGSEVAIFRVSNGFAYAEGFAKIISACDGDADFYQVRFCGEQVNRVRLVIPEFQADPDRALERLHQLARGGDSPFDDFFPEASNPRRSR